MRGARSLAAPLLVVLVVAPFLAIAVYRASWATLGRDQGIFQYVAWAITRGDRLYSDVRDVNGPLVALIHLAFLKLGGADEHRFRVLDLVLSSAAFLFVGSALPSLARVEVPTRAQRTAWALAALATLLAQYLAYGYWETAQRESFFDWFVLVAIAFHAYAPKSPRTAALFLFLAGAASIAPCFGKPTYALFTIVQTIAIAIERRRALVPFALGALVGAALLGCFLVAFGDVRAWARITFVDVPTMYRFIWPRSPLAIAALPGYAALTGWALLAFGIATTLVYLGKLSIRALTIGAMPAIGLASAFVQAKGFPYHFHPVSLGIGLAWLVVLAWTWHAARPGARPVVLAAAAVLGAHSAVVAWRAPYPPAPATWPPTAEHLAWFDRVDFFPNALRRAASYLAERTGPDERVQLYGMDAYLLFLAQRGSATPYIYAYDLDADAALAGSWDDPSLRPDAAQSAAIRALRDAHERDLLDRVSKSPPAAFVFVGRSPLMSTTDAVADFSAHCPDAAKFVREHYRETADFDGIRVWMRNDRPP